jgi:hypothetical protein
MLAKRAGIRARHPDAFKVADWVGMRAKLDVFCHNRAQKILPSLRTVKMRHDKDNSGRQSGKGADDARRERLKLALRENLKRRKSQGGERADFTISSPNPDDVTVADPGKNHPGK